MSALKTLQEKIEAWKEEYQILKKENISLREMLKSNETADSDYAEQIKTLKRELKEKDDEIEKIIKQVETLLAS